MRLFLTISLVALLTACDVPVRQCHDQTDCFAGELCSGGECVAGALELDASDAASPDVTGDADASQPGDCRLGDDSCGDLVCNVSTGACESCQRDVQCDRGEICERTLGVCVCDADHHDCGGTCLPNDATESCGTRCDPCPDAPNGTAVCTDGQCGIDCEPPFRPCDGCGLDLECIECEANPDCSAYDASLCVEGLCVGCQSNADCGHLDQAICVDGVCEQCDTGQSDACGGNSCDPATLTCTGTAIGSRDWCETCVADSECRPNHRCIPMFFGENRRPGGYCLVEADSECLLPHPIQVQRDSLSGVKGEFYCIIREDLTTCEAVKGFGDNCDQDADCGADETNDAYCRLFDGREQCTYPCATSNECSGGTTCIGNPPDNSYCARF